MGGFIHAPQPPSRPEPRSPSRIALEEELNSQILNVLPLQNALPGFDLPAQDDACEEGLVMVEIVPVPAGTPRRAFPTATPPPPSISISPLWWLSAAVLALAIGALLSLTPYGAFGHRWLGLGQRGALSELGPASIQRLTAHSARSTRDAALGQARKAVSNALAITPNQPGGMARLIKAHHASNPQQAWQWLQNAPDPQHPAMRDAALTLLLREGRFDEAQGLGWKAASNHPQNKALHRLLAQAYARDPAHIALLPVTLRPGREFQAFEPDSTQQSAWLALNKEGQHIATFIPNLRKTPARSQATLAAWRLCQTLGCGLDTVPSRQARLELSDMAPLGLSTETMILDLRDHGVWLYGTWQPRDRQKTLGNLTPDPGWVALLDQQTPLKALDAPALDIAQEPVSPRLSGLMESRSGTWLATQMSQLAVMRFLTAAPSGAPVYTSARGLLYRPDAESWFTAAPSNQDTRQQLQHLQRFSRHTIERLRLMTRQDARTMLFGLQPARKGQNTLLERFWQRRERLLARIDLLVARHGEAAILCFQ